jgi:dTDP-4-amino-4,6-dideoxygalactose transaminase
VDIGSSYLPGELTAAFLYAQLEEADDITTRRLTIWNHYHNWAALLEEKGLLRRPIVPNDCTHNAHMYYLLLSDLEKRTRFIEALKRQGIHAVFHYLPLHLAPAGQRFGRAHGDLKITVRTSDTLVRLPFWLGLEQYLDFVLDAAGAAFG